MGFFDFTPTCKSCNIREVGPNRNKIIDGWLCSNCKEKYKDGYRTFRTFKEVIENNKKNINEASKADGNKTNLQINIDKNSNQIINDNSLSSIQKLRFKKYISEQSGMNLADVDFYLSSIPELEYNELVDSFKKHVLITNEGVELETKIIQTTVNVVQQNNNPRCPKCKSRETTFNKQGFGVGKAAVGVILTGGFGLLAGGINKNKIKLSCLKCGHSWKAG
jgi:ribosomal protein L37AE/L43A